MKAIRHRAALAGTALLLSAAVACGTNEPATDDMTTMDERLTPAAEGAPITLMGCLQETGSDFVLTALNTPASGTAGAVGTSGDMSADRPAGTSGTGAPEVAGSPSPQAAHMSAARQSYRLDGDDDRLRAHVGAQVRVMGTLEESADLRSGGMFGQGDRVDRTDIDSGDLAEVSVTSIERVAETCGGDAPVTPGMP